MRLVLSQHDGKMMKGLQAELAALARLQVENHRHSYFHENGAPDLGQSTRHSSLKISIHMALQA